MTGSTTAVSGGLTLVQLVALAALGMQDSSPTTVGFHVPEEPVLTAASVGKQPYEYLGTKRCRMCHVQQYWSWKKSPKGQSFDALKPGVNPKIKTLAGLDVTRDYTTDERCLPCHCVGYQEPGGYMIPDPQNGESVSRAASRQGAGCEACHGPGSGFVTIMQDIYRTDRTYRPEELHAAGRKPVEPEVCLKCHNDNAICIVVSGEFVADEQRMLFQSYILNRRGFHAKFPLEHRAPLEPANAAWPGNKSKDAE